MMDGIRGISSHKQIIVKGSYTHFDSIFKGVFDQDHIKTFMRIKHDVLLQF